jgi:hypothetical protein
MGPGKEERHKVITRHEVGEQTNTRMEEKL